MGWKWMDAMQTTQALIVRKNGAEEVVLSTTYPGGA